MHHGTWVTRRDAYRDRWPTVAGETLPVFPAHAHPQFYVSGKRPMWGILTWFDYLRVKIRTQRIFTRFQLFASKPFVKWSSGTKWYTANWQILARKFLWRETTSVISTSLQRSVTTIFMRTISSTTTNQVSKLQWRHNECDGAQGQ